MTNFIQILTKKDRSNIRKDIYKKSCSKVDFTNISDEKINFFIKYVIGKRVLDLGSIDHDPENRKSKYWLFSWLNTYSKTIVGLDYYEKGVNELSKSGYKIVLGDAQNFKFYEMFDVITAGDIIEHLPNPGLMFRCVNKHLKSGGHFIISTPNVFCWKYVFNFWITGNSNKANKEHVMWFCPTMLEWLAKRYGFKMVEQKFCSRRWWEKIIVLPKQIKHTTLNFAFQKL